MIQENVRILLVEDDEDDYIITKSLLSEIKGQQFHLDWVKSFDKGLELMVSNKHDACLVDYRSAPTMALNCCAAPSSEDVSRHNSPDWAR